MNDKNGRQISLSVFNPPSEMIKRRPATAKSMQDIVTALPGFKPVKAKGEGSVAKEKSATAKSPSPKKAKSAKKGASV